MTKSPSLKGNKTLIVILGPTAAGKTSLAIEVAKALDTEIISSDSRQFFREMNIGTAKPSALELQQVKHHFIDSLSITDEYNVGKFEREALSLLEKIFKTKKTAVMVGGSGLYINAVCNGFDEVPEADKQVRERLTTLYKTEGIGPLQNMLKELDPEHFQKMDIKNPHRLIRALEVCMVTGKAYSDLRKGEKQKRNFNIVKIGLEVPREQLYQKINARVDSMMQDGLLEEAKGLASFRPKAHNALQTVGYKELFDHFDGKYDLARAVELIKQNTRNFAKRQMTWFKKDKDIAWFDPKDLNGIMKLIRRSIES